MSGSASDQFEIDILGDTALLLRFGERIDAALNARVHAVAQALRAAHVPGVRELVPAYASIAVHYEPAAWHDATAKEAPCLRIAARLRELVAHVLDQERERPLTPTLSPDAKNVGGEGDIYRAPRAGSLSPNNLTVGGAGSLSPNSLTVGGEGWGEGALVEIPVCYGGEFGPDLREVAEHAQLAEADVIALHSAGEYRVAMLGFAPGFPYLLGLDARLHMPRRANPRTRVAAGSVAIGGAQTGIYPRELPGGWRLIGRTPLALFDAQRDPPALLAPGQRVRFRSISSASVDEYESPKAAAPDRSPQPAGITIVSPGLLTTVQDGGRAGHAAIGVGGAGAMDAVALRLANSLVDNALNAAALEITLRGPRLRFAHDTLIALTGAAIEAQCDGLAVPLWRPLLLRAGSELALGGMRHGTRAYLAVAGGFDLPPLLGSRCTDINAGLGPIPRPLAAGDVLSCAPSPKTLCRELWNAFEARPQKGRNIAATNWSLDPAPWFDASGTRVIHLVPGTHFDHLDAEAQRALFAHEFRVGVDSNRVGLRLEGVPLRLAQPFESISAGVAPGTVQLPPGGVPIALAAEAPTTGGYPRIGHVIAVDQPYLAQRRPGDAVRFARCELAEAQIRYLERERALSRLACDISERLKR